MEILLLILLILLNGVFAMSEIALVTARRGRLLQWADRGDRAAGVAIKLHDEPTRFLSTVQIGITSIGLLNGIVGETILAEPLAARLQAAGADAELAGLAATALVVVGITYASIVMGELVPKRIGQISPEKTARLVARPMHALARLTRPFVYLLAVSTESILRVTGQRNRERRVITEEEIEAVLDEGSAAGVIESSERKLVRNVLRLDELKLPSLMVPRSEIAWLDVEQDLEANLDRVAGCAFSQFPVCRGGLDHVLGMVDVKDLLRRTLQGTLHDLETDLRPVAHVPESLTAMDLLEQLRASDARMVLVVDEYGDVQGLVTLQDLLEAMTGEFEPAREEESRALRRGDGSWLLDGLLSIPEVVDTLELKSVPEEGKGRYHTLNGLVVWLLGRLAQTGDQVVWEGWCLEVVDMDGKRIDKVLASRRPEGVPGDSAA